MSYTEMFALKENRSIDYDWKEEVRNSYRGAMAIWIILEKKYLPSLPKPDRLSYNEKIVLLSTFDNVLIKRENFKKVIDAFNSFEGETSLKEQAKIIQDFNEDKDITAIGWNQTSVNCSPWISRDPVMKKQMKKYHMII